MTSAGVDVWGTADQLTLASRAWTGDGVFIVRVASLQNVAPWTKAGLMLRETTSAGSKHVFLLVSPSKGIALQRRLENDGLSFNTAGPLTAAPVWLKMERRGTTINAFTSADGTAWKPVGSTAVAFAATVNVGLAVSSHDPVATATATFSDLSVSPLLPNGWSSIDIGGARQGAADFAGGKFTIDAGGADIWGTSDQFRFTYQAVTGDADVIARVASVAGAQSWLKAGVMVRGALGSAAAHASLFVSKDKGVAFQRRIQSGVSTVSTPGPLASAPGWLKVERRGDVLTAFWSTDGVAWTVMGSEVVVLPATFYAGLAVTSHDATTLGRGTFDSVRISPVGPNVPPTVTLTSPVPNALVPISTTVALTANASDGDGTVAKVEFYAGGTLVGSDTTAPFAMSWTGAAAGSYDIAAVAIDDQGAKTTSATHTITIEAANKPPVVSLTTPIAQSTFVAPAAISLIASASDADGQVTKVDFYGDGALLGSSTAAPFSATWTTAAAGSHLVWAEAFDNRGAVVASAQVALTVSAPAPLPSAAAAFIRSDLTTGGAWRSAYGKQGYSIPSDATAYPAYAQVAIGGADTYLWPIDTTGDARALQRATGTGSLASCWYAAGSFTVDVNLTDGQSHQVALYMLDWDNGPRTQRVDVLDAASGAVIDTRTVTAFQGGQYLVWNLSGHVAIRFTNTGRPNALLTGMFFDAIGLPATTVNLTSPAGTSFPAPTTIALAAAVNPAPGRSISRVEFLSGATVIGSATASPYSVGWTAPPGSYSITARATDNLGAVTTSTPLTLTVNDPAPDAQPPVDTSSFSVAFTPSPDHAIVASYRVEVYRSTDVRGVAAPVAAQNIGKPTIVAGECAADITNAVIALPPGDYVAVVVAVGTAGEAPSAASLAFSR